MDGNQTLEGIVEGIWRFIEVVYNRKRLHLAWVYRPAAEVQSRLVGGASGAS